MVGHRFVMYTVMVIQVASAAVLSKAGDFAVVESLLLLLFVGVLCLVLFLLNSTKCRF